MELNLSHCDGITDNGIQALASSLSRLISLRLDKCKGIKTKNIQAIATVLPFSNVAKHWIGWEPKENALELIEAEERFREETDAALILQKCYRGAAARGGVGKLKRQRMEKLAAIKIQKIYRGKVTRRNYLNHLKEKAQEASSLVIQQCWKRAKAKEELNKRKRIKALRDQQDYYVRKVQARFRGLLGRKEYKRRLQVREAKLKDIAVEHERRVRAATLIQRKYRHHRVNLAYQIQKSYKLEQKRLEEEVIKSTSTLQRIFRGHQGKKAANDRRAYLEFKAKELNAVRLIQRTWRGKVGREYAKKRRIERRIKIERDAAITIQVMFIKYLLNFYF